MTPVSSHSDIVSATTEDDSDESQSTESDNSEADIRFSSSHTDGRNTLRCIQMIRQAMRSALTDGPTALRVLQLIVTLILWSKPSSTLRQAAGADVEIDERGQGADAPLRDQQRIQGQKRRRDPEGNDGSDNDEIDRRSRKRNPQRSEVGDESEISDQRKLACPYFKHDPVRLGSRSPCCGPGWPTVHRLK
jgi:hypothetical protein